MCYVYFFLPSFTFFLSSKSHSDTVRACRARQNTLDSDPLHIVDKNLQRPHSRYGRSRAERCPDIRSACITGTTETPGSVSSPESCAGCVGAWLSPSSEHSRLVLSRLGLAAPTAGAQRSQLGARCSQSQPASGGCACWGREGQTAWPGRPDEDGATGREVPPPRHRPRLRVRARSVRQPTHQAFKASCRPPPRDFGPLAH